MSQEKDLNQTNESSLRGFSGSGFKHLFHCFFNSLTVNTRNVNLRKINLVLNSIKSFFFI